MAAYRFLPFSGDSDVIVTLISDFLRTIPSVVRDKKQLNYLISYVKKLGCKTVIFESDYIDHDYIVDFSSYYVRCFHRYERKCCRIHFFKKSFTEEFFSELIINKRNKRELSSFSKSYLGFVVIRPLPFSFIGRTCLRTYPSDKGRRQFPARRDYPASLFGVDLIVKNSIAFQEQDRVLGACATCALWSAFHCTGKLFQHQIPSPVEITESATKLYRLETRILPNYGLTYEQMAQAIRDVGLDPLPINAVNDYIIKGAIYSYLSAGIPIVLGIALLDSSTKSSVSRVDMHAVTITGFSLANSENSGAQDGRFNLLALNIDKLYVHDDQIGPFAKMKFINGHLSTDYKNAAGIEGYVIAIPDKLLVPLYHKIRIPFEVIFRAVMSFEVVLAHIIDRYVGDLDIRGASWEISLKTVEAYKQETRLSDQYDDHTKEHILTKELPRYLWVARGNIYDVRLIELIMDATDVEKGNYGMFAIVFNDMLGNILGWILRDINFLGMIRNRLAFKMINNIEVYTAQS